MNWDDVLAARDEAIRAALFAHDGMERLIREEGLPREAVEPEPVGFLAALEGLGYTVRLATSEPRVRRENARLRELLALMPSGTVGPDKVPWFKHCGISHGAERPDCVACIALLPATPDAVGKDGRVE